MRALRDLERFGERHLSSKNNHVGMGLTLLFVGIGIGAIAALLYAPDSGRKTRRKIRRTYEDARDAVNQWSERAVDWATDARDEAAERVKPFRKAWS